MMNENSDSIVGFHDGKDSLRAQTACVAGPLSRRFTSPSTPGLGTPGRRSLASRASSRSSWAKTPTPNFFIENPPGPAQSLECDPEPSMRTKRLRNGVCRVTDICGDRDSGASGCYLIFRGYPCVITSLMQVPTIGRARQSSATFYEDLPIDPPPSLHPLQKPRYSSANTSRPLVCPLLPQLLWEPFPTEGLVACAIDAAALAPDSDLTPPFAAGPDSEDALGGLRALDPAGHPDGAPFPTAYPTAAEDAASKYAMDHAAMRTRTLQPTAPIESSLATLNDDSSCHSVDSVVAAAAAAAISRRGRAVARAALIPKVLPLVPSLHIEAMDLNETWIEGACELAGFRLGRVRTIESPLVRAVDARAIWYVLPVSDGLAGSGVFLHGQWVGVSVQTSIKEVPRRCARIDALLSTAARNVDLRPVTAAPNYIASQLAGGLAVALRAMTALPFGRATTAAPGAARSMAAPLPALGVAPGDGAQLSESKAVLETGADAGQLRVADERTAAAAAAAAATKEMDWAAAQDVTASALARRVVHFPDLTPMAHGGGLGATRADDTALWTHGTHELIPGADAVELGTWAEEHTMDDLIGSGTGLGMGLQRSQTRGTGGREAQERSLSRAHSQRRARESHRRGQREDRESYLRAAVDDTQWGPAMVAAAVKAAVEDNEEATRRITACCANAALSALGDDDDDDDDDNGAVDKRGDEQRRGGGDSKSWQRVGPSVVTHHRTVDGDTLLHVAALHGSFHVAAALLELGADLGAAALNGDTAVHRAAYHGHLSVLRVFAARAIHLAKRASSQARPATVSSSSSSRAARAARGAKVCGAAVASAGSEAVARTVIALLDARNCRGERAVDVLMIRLSQVGEFEKWPQIQKHPHLSVLHRYKLALAWFEEAWGIRVERPPAAGPAYLDPMLAYLMDPPFEPYRTKFEATLETIKTARLVSIGKAESTETLHFRARADREGASGQVSSTRRQRFILTSQSLLIDD